jgi:hypothetical protein
MDGLPVRLAASSTPHTGASVVMVARASATNIASGSLTERAVTPFHLVAVMFDYSHNPHGHDAWNQRKA